MDAPVQTAAPTEAHVDAQWVAALIQHRQTVLPRRLVEPGPDDRHLESIFSAAAAAPDHGELVPWRFVVIPAHARALAKLFGVEAGEQAVCFVSIGTAARRKAARPRPNTSAFVSILPPAA